MGKILITGGNGVLGSALSKMFLDLGDEVNVIDTVRQDECWRLIASGIQDQVNYNWKSSLDLSQDEVNGYDMIVDCAIGFPDRPFGNNSPTAAVNGNIDPAIGLLESLRKLQNPHLWYILVALMHFMDIRVLTVSKPLLIHHPFMDGQKLQ